MDKKVRDAGPFLRKIATTMPPTDHAKVVERACWLMALVEAEQMIEAMTLKDMARMIVEGVMLGPYEDYSCIERWLDEQFTSGCGDDGNDFTEETFDAWLDERIYHFFGKE